LSRFVSRRNRDVIEGAGDGIFTADQNGIVQVLQRADADQRLPIVAEMRDLSPDLRPALLDDLGLVPSLRWYLDDRAQASPAEDPAAERRSA
jgi:signal transduction histidine kinase